MMIKDKIICPCIPFHLSVGDESLNEVVTLLKTILYQLIIISEAIENYVDVTVKEFAILKLVNVTPMGLGVRYVTNCMWLLCNFNYVIKILNTF